MLPRNRKFLRARLTLAGLTTIGLAIGLIGCSPVGEENQGGGEAPPSPGATDTSTARPVKVGDPADPAAIKPGGRLDIALSAEPDLLDPTQARSLYSRYVFSATCEKLYDLDEKSQIVPQLAEALPEASEDGKTVTIKVRTGIKFGDGTPFNAAAVKKSIDRNLTLETTARKSELGPIQSVDAPDETTVVIHLETPFAPLTAALSDRAGMVMSPAALDRLGDKFSTAPVCVGPFKVVKRVPQNSIELAKDPNYYDADKVYFDSIVYRIITDASIRAANLRSGDVQVADSLSTQDAPTLSTESALEVLESESLGYQGVTFNIGNADGIDKPTRQVDKPHAKDVKVRQAFDLAVDRDGLVKTVFGGLYNKACSPISPASPFSSDAAQKCPERDLDRAKQLLQEAGVTVPYRIEMITTNTPDSLRIAQALQAMVKEGGFDIQIQPVEFSSLLDQQDRGDFELLQLGWSGRIDPDANITNFVGTGGSQNVAGFSDTALDDLLTQARQEQDPEARKDLYGQITAKIQEQEPLIYLYRQRNLTGVSKQLSGVRVFSDGILRVAFAGHRK